MKKILLYLFILSPFFGFTQTYTHKTITYRDTTIDFLEFLPRNYNPTGSYKYPVIIFFSGQERVKDGYKSTPGAGPEIDELNAEGLPMYLKQGALMEFNNTDGGKDTFVVLVPWKVKDLEWYPSRQKVKQPGDLYLQERQFPQIYVDAMIAHARTLNANLRRVVLTGMSLGAGITWDYPSFSDTTAAKVAAIVPVSGRPVYAYDSSASGGTMAAICNIPEHGIYSRGYIGSSDDVAGARRAQLHVNDSCPENPLLKDSELKVLVGGHNAEFWNLVYDPNFNLNDTSLNMYQWMLAVTSARGALPVHIEYLKGKNFSEVSILEWATSKEVSFKNFEVLRSQDGKDFSLIGIVNGAGAAGAQRKEYAFKDSKPPKGLSHYKLKLVDKDGSFKFSNVVSIDNQNKSFSVERFPNPADRELNLVIDGNMFGNIEISVLDLKGNLIRKDNIRKEQARWQGTVDVQSLAKGIYVIQVKSGDGKKDISTFIKR